MELRGKGRDDQAGRLGDEPRRRDGSEAEEPNAAEPPTVDSAEQVVVRPPGDERPLAELLADPELRLARGDEKVGDVQAGRLGDEPRQRVDSEAEEPKAEESTAGESAEQAVVRPPGDERPLTELLADPELRLAGAEALELDAPMEWLGAWLA